MISCLHNRLEADTTDTDRKYETFCENINKTSIKHEYIYIYRHIYIYIHIYIYLCSTSWDTSQAHRHTPQNSQKTFGNGSCHPELRGDYHARTMTVRAMIGKGVDSVGDLDDMSGQLTAVILVIAVSCMLHDTSMIFRVLCSALVRCFDASRDADATRDALVRCHPMLRCCQPSVTFI